MSENQSLSDFFKVTEAAKLYEIGTGGVTRVVANNVLSIYLDSNSLEGKVVLDNACGPGIVTTELLARTTNIRIEATDISEPMIDCLKQSLAPNANVTAKVMDAQQLTYPDNTFDLSITLMGIMFFSELDKALGHLYRTTKPGGKCFITSWKRVETREMGERCLKRLRGQDGQFDVPLHFWDQEMENPEYLFSKLEKLGFKDCNALTKLEYAVYSGPNRLDVVMNTIPGLFSRFVKFKDDEEKNKWNQIWKEEFEKLDSGIEIKLKMWVNIAWGTK